MPRALARRSARALSSAEFGESWDRWATPSFVLSPSLSSTFCSSIRKGSVASPPSASPTSTTSGAFGAWRIATSTTRTGGGGAAIPLCANCPPPTTPASPPVPVSAFSSFEARKLSSACSRSTGSNGGTLRPLRPCVRDANFLNTRCPNVATSRPFPKLGPATRRSATEVRATTTSSGRGWKCCRLAASISAVVATLKSSNLIFSEKRDFRPLFTRSMSLMSAS
mmetsp:Transcript_15663/g.34137  ORF Transcript_15663/g.34137 Transcript_15663/m.34137 type:complete len:224 (-) Transcript_15663:241-912(-)